MTKTPRSRFEGQAQSAIERSGWTMPEFDDWDAWDTTMSPAPVVPTTKWGVPVECQNTIRPASGTGTGRSADRPSDKQMAFARSLRAERDPNFEHVAAVSRPTKRQMSQLIDALLALPKPVKVHKPADTTPVEAREVPFGTFTLVRPDGSYRTLQIGPAKWADGKTVASYLCGPDNELSYKGFAFIADNGRVSVWKAFKADGELVADLDTFLNVANRDEAHERFLDQAEAYALRSSKCMRCNHKLTVPASLHRGLGPDCAAKEGIA